MIERPVALGSPACRDLRHIYDVRNVGFNCGLRKVRGRFDKSRGDGINKIGYGHAVERGSNRRKIEQIAGYDFSAKARGEAGNSLGELYRACPAALCAGDTPVSSGVPVRAGNLARGLPLRCGGRATGPHAGGAAEVSPTAQPAGDGRSPRLIRGPVQ